jgi:guanine deaminase
MPPPTVYYGALVNPVSIESFEAHPRALIAVDNVGDIALLVKDVAPSGVEDALAAHGWKHGTPIVKLQAGEFLIPGFIDTHTVRTSNVRASSIG